MMSDEQLAERQAEMKARNQGVSPVASNGEKRYSVKDVAKMLNISKDSVRRIFEIEQGVENWGAGGKTHLRIPQVVFDRVSRDRRRGAA